ncbi:MAG: twin-arginine translocation signal domain-containing protein [Ignavibacteriales bacterium]|nr:twin-arginine translocation signal domain-containing protein [Ignavibacteriales bacterium]
MLVLEPLNPKNHPGLFLTKIPQAYADLQVGQQPVVQDRERHLPPADHRGEHHPEHRGRLGRDCRVPPRRQPRAQGADQRRDQLPQRVQVDPRPRLPGRPVHGARPEQTGQGGRARRHRRVPRLRSVLVRRGDQMSNQHETSVTRRDFVKTAAAASIAATFPASFGVFAQGSDTFKVGVIGCGGRGTGAAIDCLKADPGGRDRRPRRPGARPRRELPGHG